MTTRTPLLALLLAAPFVASCNDGAQKAQEIPPFTEDASLWLKSDLHLHSSYSEDAAENHIDELVARARDIAGFDFFVVTDHDNHLSGDMSAVWNDPAYHDHDMTVLYGVEFTTAYGHANIFGAEPWDHSELYALRDDVDAGAAIVALAHEKGLHFSVNHPMGKDLWEFDYAIGFDSLEVWNALWTVPNAAERALAMWNTQVMTEGRRIPIRGGSDGHHHRDHAEAKLNNVGNPTTWINAEENTASAILKALGQGRASVSYAPHGERVAIWVDKDHDGTFETPMGASIHHGAAPTILLGVEIGNGEAGIERTIRVFNQDSVTVPVATWTTQDLRAVLELPALTTGYYRVQLHGQAVDVSILQEKLNAGVLSISNPIYFGVE